MDCNNFIGCGHKKYLRSQGAKQTSRRPLFLLCRGDTSFIISFGKTKGVEEVLRICEGPDSYVFCWPVAHPSTRRKRLVTVALATPDSDNTVIYRRHLVRWLDVAWLALHHVALDYASVRGLPPTAYWLERLLLSSASAKSKPHSGLPVDLRHY
jgi:hypothetical protein